MAESGLGHNQRRIDQIDRSIIAALRADPQIANKQVAQDLGISEMTVANRIEGLIEDRMIKVTIQRDIRTAGYELVGVVDIYVEADPVMPLAQALGGIPDVLSVSVAVDAPQIIVFLAARSLEDFLHVATDLIGALPGVSRISTSVSLDMCLLRPGIAAL